MLNLFTILLALFSIFGVSCIIYAFLGMFIHDNNRKRLIITIAVVILSLSTYFYVENRHNVYMKEDTMYIHPIEKVKK